MENKLEFKLEELKLVIGTVRDYFGFYFRSIILYLAVMGILLKGFIDSDIGSDSRKIVYVLGQVIAIGAFIGTVSIFPKYKMVTERCTLLCQELGIPDIYTPGTIRTAKAFALGLLIFAVLWLTLIHFLNAQPSDLVG